MDEIPELHRSPDAAAEMAVNAVLGYLRESGIVDSNQKKLWIAKVFEAVNDRADRVN